MEITLPVNPLNNISPNILNDKTYRDPFVLLAEVQARAGLPQETLDQVYTDCLQLTKDSWLGFLDMFQMNMPFTTDFVQFVEHQTPDYVIDDDGAVTRALNVFTIVPANIDGWEVGEDYFFYRVNDVVAVYDNAGVKELGVITAVDKAGNNFTAVCRAAATWSVDTTNITIDVNGSDFDRASCGPEGLMELRKTKTEILKLQIIKDAIDYTGGRRYAFPLDEHNDEVAWYDENSIELLRRLNVKVAKTLMNDEESVDGSAAHAIGKYGTKGLFQKLRTDGVWQSDYIQTEAELEALTDYYDSLGMKTKEFVIHCDTQQYRYLEVLAGALGTRFNINLELELNNVQDNMMRFGFHGFIKDGYTFWFTKWELKNGNSPLGKNRIADTMPKGIIMPKGTVETKIMGETKQVPYIFKAYQDMKEKSGMIRTFFSGGFANGNGSDCENLKITKSTTVALAVVCPEAITIIG
ncbi:MAG: hypothetical protein QM499_00885 [Flavobacteriaceae bacterium]